MPDTTEMPNSPAPLLPPPWHSDDRSRPRIRDVRVILTAPEGTRLVVVKVETDEPELYGLGCATFTQRPLAVATAIEEYLRPQVIGRSVHDIEDLWSMLAVSSYWRSGPVLNNAMSGLDMALWDAVAKARRVPLWKLLADRYNGGKFDDKAWVYAAGGYYYPGKDLDGLQDEMKHYLDLGYSTVKMKIGGVPLADDLKRIEAVLKVIGGKGENLCVDVNGRYDLDQALACGAAIAPYNLRWYEEPLDPLDYLLHAALATRYAPPLATGENLFSMQDARNLIRHGGLRPDRDVLQFDPALSYGLVEYLRTLAMLQRHGWSGRRCVPHGGHQFALNIAVGLGLGGNESYPDVFAPFGGFADDCPVENSLVRLPDIPGVGFEAKSALYRVMRPLAEG